jgi:hypothetical protein
LACRLTISNNRRSVTIVSLRSPQDAFRVNIRADGSQFWSIRGTRV